MPAKRDAAIARSKAWYAANKERARASNAARYQAHKDEIRLRANANAEHIKEVKANWYARNKDKVLQGNKTWRYAHKEIEAARSPQYRNTFPQRYAANKIVMQAMLQVNWYRYRVGYVAHLKLKHIMPITPVHWTLYGYVVGIIDNCTFL